MKSLFLYYLFILVSTIIIAVILALPTMLLWNLLIPDILGLSKLSLLQTLGMTLLIKLLFGDFSHIIIDKR